MPTNLSWLNDPYVVALIARYGCAHNYHQWALSSWTSTSYMCRWCGKEMTDAD